MTFNCGWLDNKWTVAFACGVINVLTNGIPRMSPLFFVASIERYHVNRKQASFPYVLRFLIECLTGPFIGYLGYKYGVISVTKLGCIFSAIGIGICFFAENILTMTICYGILFGFGCGMSRQLLPVIISNRFQQNLSLANGIFLMGASLGSIIFSALYEYFLEVYNLSGTFLISSALILHAVPAAMLLKIPKPRANAVNESVERTEGHLKITNYNAEFEDGKCFNDSQNHEHTTSTSQNMKLSPIKTVSHLLESTESVQKSMKYFQGKGILQMMPDESGEGKSMNHGTLNATDLLYEAAKEKLNHGDSNTTKNSIPNCNENNPNKMYFQKPLGNNYAECAGIDKNFSKQVLKSQTKKNVSFLKVFSIFLDPVFFFVSLNQSLYLLTVIVFMTVIIDFSRDIDIPQHEEVYILINIAVSDLVGRLCFCWISDKKYIDINNFSALCFIAFAALLMALSFSNSFTGVMILVVCVMLTAGVQRTLCPGVVSKFFDGEMKTMAMASTFLLIGPLSFAVPPLIGLFRIQLGSYVGLFWLISALHVYCGLIQYLLPIFAEYRKKKTYKIQDPK